MPFTVLIVEDEFFIRYTIAEFLREEGYHILEAENAEAALSAFRGGTHVDVMFTDIRMPGEMDGLGLADEVRSRWPHTKIIMTSGYAPELLTARRAAARGEVLSKPYRPHAVLATIRALLGSCAIGGGISGAGQTRISQGSL